jgi:predicted TIM-barrel fold metal-dependent hydrolase
MCRNLYPLLERHSNLYLETSTYMVHRGIEEFVRLFGAERLLFGSRYAAYAPGAAVAGLMYAEISDRNRRLIAGDNARRLLRGVQR